MKEMIKKHWLMDIEKSLTLINTSMDFMIKKLFMLLFQMTAHWTLLQSSIRQVIRQVIVCGLHQTNSKKRF